MNRGQFEKRYYLIEGNGIQTHCKVTEYGINMPNYKCTMSFGSGDKRFCVVAAFLAIAAFLAAILMPFL